MTLPNELNIPAGYRLAPELKTERIQLLVKPSTKEVIKAKADAEGISLNECVNQILEAQIAHD